MEWGGGRRWSLVGHGQACLSSIRAAQGVWVAVALLVAATAALVAPSSATARMRPAVPRDVGLTRIVAPGDDALVVGRTLRLVLRTRRGATVRLYIDARRASGRLWGGRGRLRRARLRGLRRGPHHLLVLTRTRRGGFDADGRRFVVGRHRERYLELRVKRSRGEPVRVRFALRDRVRTLRATLNGRDVLPAFLRGGAASLSASHGLRFGRNVLRVVAVARDGRYDVERRVVVIPRRRPLAGAGRDRRARREWIVRLNGRSSRPSRPRFGLAYRWRVVRSPRGSRARLRAATSARPRLRVDRAGIYRVRLRVSERPRRGALSANAATVASDTVTVVGDDLPTTGVPIDTIGAGGAITINGEPQPNPKPSDVIHVLTLGRQPVAVGASPQVRQNLTFSGDSSGISALNSTLKALVPTSVTSPVPPLVVIAAPNTSGISPNSLKALNQALGWVGATPLPSVGRGPFSVIGVPGMAPGTGWVNAAGALVGELIVGTAEQAQGDKPGPKTYTPTWTFTFSDYVGFDTNYPDAPAGQLRMGTDSQKMTFSMPSGAQGALAAVAIDASGSGTDPAIVNWAVESVNTGDPERDAVAQQNFATWLFQFVVNPNDALVMIQSMGTLQPTTVWWAEIANAIASLSGPNCRALGQDEGTKGAPTTWVNPCAHVFNTVNGSYAFVGGAGLDDPASEASSALTGTPARLTGVLSRNKQTLLEPLVDDTVGGNYDLLKILYQAPQPWPHQRDPDNPNDPYTQADQYISQKLGLGGSDVRANYLNANISDWSSKVAQLPDCPASPPEVNAACLDLENDFKQEFPWVDTVGGYLDNLAQALNIAEYANAANLQAITEHVKTSLNSPEGDAVGRAFQIVGQILEWLTYLEPTVGSPPDYPSPDALGGVGALFGALGDYALKADGSSALLDAVDVKSDELSTELADNYVVSMLNLDAIKGIILSDHGKLSTVGAAATSDPRWEWRTKTPTIPGSTDLAVEAITGTATQWAYGSLMPVAYDSWRLKDKDYVGEAVTDARYYQCEWKGSPDRSHVNQIFRNSPSDGSGQFSFNTGGSGFPANPHRRVWVWGNDASNGFYWYRPFHVPSQSLTDSMFSRSGVGLIQPWFWTQNFRPKSVVSAASYLNC